MLEGIENLQKFQESFVGSDFITVQNLFALSKKSGIPKQKIIDFVKDLKVNFGALDGDIVHDEKYYNDFYYAASDEILSPDALTLQQWEKMALSVAKEIKGNPTQS